MSNENGIIFLQGQKVNLRPLFDSDINDLLRWVNDQEVTQYLTMYLPTYEKEETDWIENLSKCKSNDIVLGIESGGSLIGTIGLHGINWKDRTGTLGISIGENSYWNKGCGTEAVLLILNYAFKNLNLRKICLSVLGHNKRAKRCYEKCGFKVEGCKRRQVFKNARYVDEILMAVFRNERNKNG